MTKSKTVALRYIGAEGAVVPGYPAADIEAVSRAEARDLVSGGAYAYANPEDDDRDKAAPTNGDAPAEENGDTPEETTEEGADDDDKAAEGEGEAETETAPA